MKKTIIALMALAGGASALTITDDTTMAPADNYYAGAFDFTFEISDIAVTSGFNATEYLLGYYGQTAASGGYTGNVFTLNIVAGEATLVLNRVHSITLTDGEITSVGNVANTSTFAAEGKTYTLGVGTYKVDYLGGTNQQAAANLYLNDTLVASFTGGSHNMNGGGANGDVPLTVKVGNLSIPEPTTATLSLLALAGLAARRRRR